MYSFGVLLLEMFTGKRPTDDKFMEEGINLHNFVKMAIPDQVFEVIDKTILENEEALQVQDYSDEIHQPELESQVQETLVSIMRVGVQCSVELPKQRMPLRDVIMELEELRRKVRVISL